VQGQKGEGADNMTRLLNLLEYHFARTGEWWALCAVMVAKRRLGLNLHRKGWL
jgi:hypothetical protein